MERKRQREEPYEHDEAIAETSPKRMKLVEAKEGQNDSANDFGPDWSFGDDQALFQAVESIERKESPTESKTASASEGFTISFASGKKASTAGRPKGNDPRLQRILASLAADDDIEESDSNKPSQSSAPDDPIQDTESSAGPFFTPASKPPLRPPANDDIDMEDVDPPQKQATPTDTGYSIAFASGRKVDSKPVGATKDPRLARILNAFNEDQEDQAAPSGGADEPSLFSLASGRKATAGTTAMATMAAKDPRLARFLASMDEGDDAGVVETKDEDAPLFSFASGRKAVAKASGTKDPRLARFLAGIDDEEGAEPKNQEESSLFSFASGRQASGPKSGAATDPRLARLLASFNDEDDGTSSTSAPKQRELAAGARPGVGKAPPGKPKFSAPRPSTSATTTSTATNLFSSARIQPVSSTSNDSDSKEPPRLGLAGVRDSTVDLASFKNELDAQDEEFEKILKEGRKGRPAPSGGASGDSKGSRVRKPIIEPPRFGFTQSKATSERLEAFEAEVVARAQTAEDTATPPVDFLDLLADEADNQDSQPSKSSHPMNAEEPPAPLDSRAQEQAQELIDAMSPDELLPSASSLAVPKVKSMFYSKPLPPAAPESGAAAASPNPSPSPSKTFKATPSLKSATTTPLHRQKGFLSPKSPAAKGTVTFSPPRPISSAAPRTPSSSTSTPSQPRTPVSSGGKSNFKAPRRFDSPMASQPSALEDSTPPSPTQTSKAENAAEGLLSPRQRKLEARALVYSSASPSPKATPKSSPKTSISTSPNRKTLASLFTARGRVPNSRSLVDLQGHMPLELLKMTSDSARSFEFKYVDDTNTLCTFGVEQAKEELSRRGAGFQSVFKTKFDWETWVENHYRWIVWKLAATQRSFPEEFGGYCHHGRVVRQLLHRFEREKRLEQRPALRRGLEQDSSIKNHMVLCVAAIRYLPTNLQSPSSPQVAPYLDESTQALRRQAGGARCAIVELTDGWYGVEALLDEQLTWKVASGEIFVGQKLHICGANVLGNTEPISPLEISGPSVMLALRINSTRRAKWSEPLGFQNSQLFRVNLHSIKPDGGNVPMVDVVVQRLYPVLCLETHKGTTRVLTQRGEMTTANRFERKLSQMRDSKAKEINSEIETMKKEAMARGRAFSLRNKGKKIDWNELSIDTIYEIALASSDMGEFSKNLPHSRQQELKEYLERQQYQDLELRQQKLAELQAEDPEYQREVKKFVRLVIIDFVPTTDFKGPKPILNKATVTIWDPRPTLICELKEGSRLKMTQLTSHTSRAKLAGEQPPDILLDRSVHWTNLSLASSNYSGFFPFPLGDAKVAYGFQPRAALPFAALPTTFAPTSGPIAYTPQHFLPNGEFDSVGVVLGRSESEIVLPSGGAPAPNKQRIRQCYFLADSSAHYVAIHLTAHEESLPNAEHFKEGQIVGFKNVTYKFSREGGDFHTCEASEASEFFFGSNLPSFLQPRHQELKQWLDGASEFLTQAKARITSITGIQFK